METLCSLFADIPSQITAADVGTWLFCLATVIGIGAALLTCIVQWRKLTGAKAPPGVSQEQFDTLRDSLNERMNDFVTKDDFREIKEEMGDFRKELAAHNQQDAKCFGDLNRQMERVLTILEERFPAGGSGRKKRPG